jgi:hypothetical protein
VTAVDVTLLIGCLNSDFATPSSKCVPVVTSTAKNSSTGDLKNSSRPSALHATLSAPPLEICHFPPPGGRVCTYASRVPLSFEV